jgi:hypothetical protein
VLLGESSGALPLPFRILPFVGNQHDPKEEDNAIENLRLFVKAIIKRWWALMSCAVFTFIGLYALIASKSNAWIIGASLTSAALAFFVAAFLAWNEEHLARIKAEKQLKDEEPKIIFALLANDIDWSNINSGQEYVFTVTNIGKRIATHVEIQSLESRNGMYRIHFEKLTVLRGDGHYYSLSHEIEHGTTKAERDKWLLWDFLHDFPQGGPQPQMETFNLAIKFKDSGEDRQKSAIMRFNLDTKKLSVDPN